MSRGAAGSLRPLPLLCWSLLAGPGAAPAQHPPKAAALARFEAKLAADVAADGIGAISAAVMIGGRIRYARGFGFADAEQQRQARADTIYRVGSISKSITAVVMARLVQQGRLDLDGKVVTALPEIGALRDERGRARTITFRHLATHTAGLTREPGLVDAAKGPIADWQRKVVASIATTSFAADPGERYGYSNIGYGMLGLALSRVAGKDFMALVTDEIFVPLRMTSSTFVLDEKQRPRLAAGYLRRRPTDDDPRTADPAIPAAEHAGRGYKVPNGGVYSTAGDLCRFADGLIGPLDTGLLDATLRAEVLRVQTPGDPAKGYGLGFGIRTLPGGRRAIGHGGSVAGYNAYLVFEPQSRTVVALLRNYNRGRTDLGAAATALLDELTR